MQEKVAFVSGSGKNLGASIAIDLAKKGYKIAVHYNKSKKEAEITLKQVQEFTKAMLVNGDLNKPEVVKRIFKEVTDKLGHVDVLVNLIGNFIFKPISKTEFSKFRDVIESNLYSTFLCCNEVLPHMVKKRRGKIINFGCIAADSLTIRKNTTPYYIAKTGVIMLTKVLANDYAKYGITVNSVSPGILKTSIVKTKTPSGRYADFSDIINAINFLLEDKSAYINGANIEVAGGWRPGFDG